MINHLFRYTILAAIFCMIQIVVGMMTIKKERFNNILIKALIIELVIFGIAVITYMITNP